VKRARLALPSVIVISLSMIALASPALAQPRALVLRADGDAGVMLTSRYRDRFDWGGGFTARVGIELFGPLLELHVGGGGAWFPVAGQVPGTLYTVSGGARSTFRIDRSALGGPFVEVDAGLGITGSLARFVLQVGAGWSFAPVEELFFGPIARYLLIVQDPSDPVPDLGHLVFVGLEVAGRIALDGQAPPAPAPAPPALDTDGDRVPDDVDRCPDQAEDVDGHLDDDGCPDLDNDSDGVPDADDRCPTAAEVRNGFEDEDGCPDEAPAPPPAPVTTVVVVPHGTPGRPLEPYVLFRLGSARVSPRYHDAITEVCQLALSEAGSRLRVIGHADEQGTAAGNQRLGAERAGAVAEQLILCGVAPDRIESVSYGDQRPVCDEATEDCRTVRRRVQFEIVEQPTEP
jgi:outer membrane protein OmpA-like peptidoglycan-associated protein